MKLLTQELRKKLPPLNSQQNEEDPMVICKFFHPLSSMTWYAIEGSPVDEDGYYDTDKEKVDFFSLVGSIQTSLNLVTSLSTRWRPTGIFGKRISCMTAQTIVRQLVSVVKASI